MKKEDKDNIPVPDFTGEEMKMPENTDGIVVEEVEESTIINGPLLLILAVLLVAILGGMYYWFSILNVPTPVVTTPVERPTAAENNEPESPTAEAQQEVLQTTSTSDEMAAIEADFDATGLDELDAEMNAIDAELDAALQ